MQDVYIEKYEGVYNGKSFVAYNVVIQAEVNGNVVYLKYPLRNLKESDKTILSLLAK